jgi:hypothetical protein
VIITISPTTLELAVNGQADLVVSGDSDLPGESRTQVARGARIFTCGAGRGRVRRDTVSGGFSRALRRSAQARFVTAQSSVTSIARLFNYLSVKAKLIYHDALIMILRALHTKQTIDRYSDAA